MGKLEAGIVTVTNVVNVDTTSGSDAVVRSGG